MENRNKLQGWRILVLEDDPLIGLDLALLLEGAGAKVIGPAHSVASALRLIDRDPLDGAVLDVDIGDCDCRRVVDTLNGLDVAYVFHTGTLQRQSDVLSGNTAPVLTKPCSAKELVETLAGRIGQS